MKSARPKLGRPPVSDRGPKVSAGYRLTPEAVDALDEIARVGGETKAAVLERLILREHRRVCGARSEGVSRSSGKSGKPVKR